MTVQSTANRADFTGDGVTVVFPYNFLVFNATDMVVMLDGVVQSSGYTVSGLGSQTGGDVTFDVAPPVAVPGILIREVPLTQLVDFTPYGPFPAESNERALDLAAMGRQQQSGADGRSLRVPVTEPSVAEIPDIAGRAGMLLGFDGLGTPVAVPATGGGSGGIPEAPADGLVYGRKAPTWVPVPETVVGTGVPLLTDESQVGTPYYDQTSREWWLCSTESTTAAVWNSLAYPSVPPGKMAESTGLRVAVESNDNGIAVTAGRVVVRSDAGLALPLDNVSFFSGDVVAAGVGAGGYDADGVQTTNSWAWVWLIYDPVGNQTNIVLSSVYDKASLNRLPVPNRIAIPSLLAYTHSALVGVVRRGAVVLDQTRQNDESITMPEVAIITGQSSTGVWTFGNYVSAIPDHCRAITGTLALGNFPAEEIGQAYIASAPNGARGFLNVRLYATLGDSPSTPYRLIMDPSTGPAFVAWQTPLSPYQMSLTVSGVELLP